jgi:hypothetical protein
MEISAVVLIDGSSFSGLPLVLLAKDRNIKLLYEGRNMLVWRSYSVKNTYPMPYYPDVLTTHHTNIWHCEALFRRIKLDKK